MPDERTCMKCAGTFPLSQMVVFRRNGKTYHRHSCKSCEAERRIESSRKSRELTLAHARKRNARYAAMRKADIEPERWILQDSTQSDRKRGRDNDLTREFILAQINKGCSYCGETQLRMTLDRIDNSRGHTQDNVNPACIRCNYVRGDMPYEAWLTLAPAMQDARVKGQFGRWTGRPH